jgi:hypothetical protein
MQLKDLVKPISEMTDEELTDRLRLVRKSRTTIRPAAKAHAKRNAKKGATTRINKVEALLECLSRDELIKLLESSDGNSN